MSRREEGGGALPRRDFLKRSAASAAAMGAAGASAAGPAGAGEPQAAPSSGASAIRRPYDMTYSGDRLSRVAFPLGGMGAGMVCMEGCGAISHVSLRNRPEVFNEPAVFAAVSVKGKPAYARVLEGPVPGWKLFGAPGTGNGAAGTTFGLPRFTQAVFRARFPFATLALDDPRVPIHVEVTGWSPFVPNDADASSLPVAALEYRFTSSAPEALEAVFSFNAKNFVAPARKGKVRPVGGGFVLHSGPTEKAGDEVSFCAVAMDGGARSSCAWFRGGWWDALTVAWNAVRDAAVIDRPPPSEGDPSPGGSVFVPFRIGAGESKSVVLLLSWYAGRTDLRVGKDAQGARPEDAGTYTPWYAGRFAGIDEVTASWRERYADLRRRSAEFSDCFHDTTLPPEAVEAVAANLTILKSPTVLRQADGRLWGWEGCSDNSGCCHGSCTHVWNYAQAIPHLFPALERTLRETEFGPSQDEMGHQMFRSALPIRPLVHDFHAAADGQLGGILKVYREWRIGGDTEWLRRIWPRARASLNWCIGAWDPKRKGVLEEPHHNTYDIEFWGPDGMCTSFYLAALQAAVLMGKAAGDDVSEFEALLRKGSSAAESELWGGEYFIQKVRWEGLQAKSPLDMQSMVGNYSPEAIEVFRKEGPKYQYGTGCLSDGVLGSWLALVCGVGQVLDREKVKAHLRSVHRHNLKKDLSDHANPQRPAYACGKEGGLLLCTWPHGGKPTLPFVYSDEVWTGIEYQVASHLMFMGLVDEGLEIVRACRDRYDGRVRNPFNEYECGHWYARAMSSYALLQGLAGARYDAVERVLHLQPSIRGDFRAFLSTAGGWGTVGVKDGKPFLEVRSGKIDVDEVRYVKS